MALPSINGIYDYTSLGAIISRWSPAMPNGTELYLCPKWLWKISGHPCTRGLGSPRMVPLQASISVSPYITTSKACTDQRTLSRVLCMPTKMQTRRSVHMCKVRRTLCFSSTSRPAICIPAEVFADQIMQALHRGRAQRQARVLCHVHMSAAGGILSMQSARRPPRHAYIQA